MLCNQHELIVKRFSADINICIRKMCLMPNNSNIKLSHRNMPKLGAKARNKKEYSNRDTEQKKSSYDNRQRQKWTVLVHDRRLWEFDGYTPFNVPLKEIMANIENSDLHTMLEKLSKMKSSPDKRNKISTANSTEIMVMILHSVMT